MSGSLDPNRNVAQPGPAPEVEVRERLLIAASEVFARKGYAATSVNEIVAAAGVTKPVLYYYFQSKAGIYQALLEQAYRKFENIVQATLDHRGTVTERLLTLSARVCQLSEEHQAVVRLIHAIFYGPPQGAPFFDFEQFHNRLQNSFLTLVEEGIRTGELPPVNPADLTWAVLGMVSTRIECMLAPQCNLVLDQEGLNRVVRLILAGVQALGNQAAPLAGSGPDGSGAGCQALPESPIDKEKRHE